MSGSAPARFCLRSPRADLSVDVNLVERLDGGDTASAGVIRFVCAALSFPRFLEFRAAVAKIFDESARADVGGESLVDKMLAALLDGERPLLAGWDVKLPEGGGDAPLTRANLREVLIQWPEVFYTLFRRYSELRSPEGALSNLKKPRG